MSAGPTGVPWAVGAYCELACDSLVEVDHTLTLRPGSAGWSRVPAPSPGSAQLAGVSVGAGGTAWAVGWDSAGTLIMRWDTRRWRAVPSPSRGASAQLFSVSAGRGGTAWAVGTYCVSQCGPGNFWPIDRTLILHLGARGWQIVPTPKSGGNGRLISVSAGPDGNVWTAGYHCASGCGTGSEVDRTLVLRWQGTRWAAG